MSALLMWLFFFFLSMSVNSHEGVQCLLDESLVKLSREHSRSLADVTLSQRSSDDSASLLWSSQVDVEGGCSSFSGMLPYYSCSEREMSAATPTLSMCNSTSSAGRGLITVCSRNTGVKMAGLTFLFLIKILSMSPWYQFTASSSHCLTIIYVFILFRALR